MARISKEFQELKNLFSEEMKIEEENLESTDINIELLVSLKENAIYI